jgi:hypothetical protein
MIQMATSEPAISEPAFVAIDPLQWLANPEEDPSDVLSDFAAHCVFGGEIAKRARAVRLMTGQHHARLASIPDEEPPVNPDDVLPPED